MVHLLRDQKGQALFLVLILSAVIFLIGSAAVVMGTAARKNAVQETWQKKAYYIAEAGVEMALANLQERYIYLESYERLIAPGFENFSIDGRPYAGGMLEGVSVTKEENGTAAHYIIVSSARYPAVGDNPVRQSLRVKVKVVPDPFLSYGGPGLKSDSGVSLGGLVNFTEGSLLARTGDVEVVSVLTGNIGGIYAGRNVYLQGVSTSGGGEIKAGKDVNIGGIVSTWSGEIWAGEDVDGPWIDLGEVSVHEHCGSDIPGLPLPSFPVVDENSVWYERVKEEAESTGQYYENASQFLDARINWNPRLWRFPWPFDDYYFVDVSPQLDLSGVTVVDGDVTLDLVSMRAAYDRWKDIYRQQHPGEEIFPDEIIPSDLLEELLEDLLKPVQFTVVTAEPGATIIADSIKIEEGMLGVFGVDTSGVDGTLGLFAVAGDVIYNAAIGSGGSLSVIANGAFECETAGNITLNWVAAKEDVEIDALVNFNVAETSVPPGTPVGYQIVEWEQIW